MEVLGNVATFGSSEEMFEYLAESRAKADEAVESWQQGFKVGDYFLRLYAPGLIIYGEVLDPAKPVFPCSKEEASEIEEEASLYRMPHMQHIRFTNCFSQVCPEGELGDTHVCNMHAKLTREEFEAAKKAEWPVEPTEVLRVLGLNIAHQRE